MDHFRGHKESETSKFCDVIRGTRENHMQIHCRSYTYIAFVCFGKKDGQ